MQVTVEINLALWGMILCAGVQAAQRFAILLAQKPLSERDGCPGNRGQPSKCRDTCQS